MSFCVRWPNVSGDFVKFEEINRLHLVVLYFHRSKYFNAYSFNQPRSSLVQDDFVGDVLKHEVKNEVKDEVTDEANEVSSGVNSHHNIGWEVRVRLFCANTFVLLKFDHSVFQTGE